MKMFFAVINVNKIKIIVVKNVEWSIIPLEVMSHVSKCNGTTE